MTYNSPYRRLIICISEERGFAKRALKLPKAAVQVGQIHAVQLESKGLQGGSCPNRNLGSGGWLMARHGYTL